MDRRAFVSGVALGLLAAPLARAQQAGRVYRVGYLSPSMPAPSLSATSLEHLLSSPLRDLGYVEGRNLVIERRFAGGEITRLPGLARELVQHRVDVIVAVSNSAILAAKEATMTIPVVMGFGSEPVERGFVMSFARPGAGFRVEHLKQVGWASYDHVRLLALHVRITPCCSVLQTFISYVHLPSDVQRDFGGCRGPQSPKSTRLTDVDVVWSLIPPSLAQALC
jgi:ABC transporter substrate binding protein